MTEVWLQEEGSKGCNSKACKPVASRSGDQSATQLAQGSRL